MKTNAMRALDREGVGYETRAYDVDESDLSAETVAAKVGLPPEQVFKSIVARGDRTGVLVALVPAGSVVEPRLLAAASGNKRADVVPLRDVLDLTGYVRGAVTPFALKKPYPIVVDETVELWPIVSVSAGQRGLQIIVTPADLIRVTGATLADIARPA
jgi:Cys-tRNA(Pro)/Cys-tRNA(Cys) deacylase